MTAMRASIVWLPVTDLDRSVEFYTGRLGLPEEHRGRDWAEVQADGMRIGLNSSQHESPHGNGGAVIAFEPDGDLDGAVAELRDQGVEFAGEISEHPWGRIATFKDPDGNDLQLYEPPSG